MVVMSRPYPNDTQLAQIYGVTRQTIATWWREGADVCDPESVLKTLRRRYRFPMLTVCRIKKRRGEIEGRLVFRQI